jgi:outer membrane receptor for ferrienterochelin and colicin
VNQQEIIPGAFFEYTQTIKDIFTLIAGIRADQHNEYGLLITPRLHLRYQPTEQISLRASAGKGYRKTNVFAENYSIMASQRKIHFLEELKMENAWNYGINMTIDFKLFKFPAQFDLEYYHTDFINQVIVDMDSDPAAVFIYNLDGKSYSNSYQAQLSFEPVKRLKTLIAFRINDVKTTINDKLLERPFTNVYKGLVTLSYIFPKDHWQLDLTSQFNGKTRIPDTKKMPAALQREEYSPAWTNILGQVTYRVKRWEMYVGAENLLDFTQKDPITEAWAPYHTHFDTSMVWGPIVGAKYYTGVRYTIK